MHGHNPTSAANRRAPATSVHRRHRSQLHILFFFFLAALAFFLLASRRACRLAPGGAERLSLTSSGSSPSAIRRVLSRIAYGLKKKKV